MISEEVGYKYNRKRKPDPIGFVPKKKGYERMSEYEKAFRESESFHDDK